MNNNILIPEEENKVKMTNTEPFQVLVITPNSIKDKQWNDINYIYNLVNSDYCKYIKMKPDEFVTFIGNNLLVKKYKNPYIKTQLIFEEYKYITEIMYVDVSKDEEDETQLNEFGSLLNINGDKIYGNAIITRSFISTTDHSMYLDDVTPEKMDSSLFHRANTKAVIYDNDDESYKEVLIFGSTEDYANNFFDNKYTIKKIELPFLKHNINIWYSTDKYGNLNACGKLIPELDRVDKMIVFSMMTDDYRDSFTLDEFNKIIYLSKKLENYNTPPEFTKDEKDELGRLIIKNKYKILDMMFNRHS